MQLKNNEATANRPHGDRILNAPYVFASLADYITLVKEEKAWEKSDRNAITIFKADTISIVVTVLKQGAAMNDIQVDGFLSLQVLEGKIKIITPDGEMEVSDNNMMIFHSGIQHSIISLTDCSLLITRYSSIGEDDKII
jgi:quercetin dioxygenase-like cupin family protein